MKNLFKFFGLSIFVMGVFLYAPKALADNDPPTFDFYRSPSASSTGFSNIPTLNNPISFHVEDTFMPTMAYTPLVAATTTWDCYTLGATYNDTFDISGTNNTYWFNTGQSGDFLDNLSHTPYTGEDFTINLPEGYYWQIQFTLATHYDPSATPAGQECVNYDPIGNPIQQIYTIMQGWNNITGAGIYHIGTNGSSGGISGADSNNPIVWQEPPFTQNLQTPDFTNWWNCVYQDTGGSGSTRFYFLAVAYGTSTLSTYQDVTTFTNGTSTEVGYLPINSLPLHECPITTKTNALSPGNYQAQAGLYLYSSFTHTTTFVASSTILSFTVTSGAPVSVPGQEVTQDIACSFVISDTGINTIDNVVNGVVNGTCKVLTWLIVPKQSDFTQFSSTWDGIKNKPPFGWFTVTSNSLGAFSTSTPATSTPASLNIISNFTRPVDYGLAFLVFLSFGFFIFHRFRKFNFHQ